MPRPGSSSWQRLPPIPQLLQFADNPKVTSSQVFDLVSGVVKGDLPDAGKNFLRTVIDNGRLSVLPEIALQYRALRNAVGGSADAVVYSAFPIDAAALAELGARWRSGLAASSTSRSRWSRP
jgi:F-type H+-transporting ATPase subunit delta